MNLVTNMLKIKTVFYYYEFSSASLKHIHVLLNLINYIFFQHIAMLGLHLTDNKIARKKLKHFEDSLIDLGIIIKEIQKMKETEKTEIENVRETTRKRLKQLEELKRKLNFMVINDILWGRPNSISEEIKLRKINKIKRLELKKMEE